MEILQLRETEMTTAATILITRYPLPFTSYITKKTGYQNKAMKMLRKPRLHTKENVAQKTTSTLIRLL